MSFDVKDSGQRQHFDSGMQRDVTDGKVDYALVLDGPMFDRWAAHLTKGAEKYDKGNWLKASGDAELRRFRESAFRHFVQWYRGETDEDHAAAVFFNLNGCEYVKSQPADAIVATSDNDVVLAGWEAAGQAAVEAMRAPQAVTDFDAEAERIASRFIEVPHGSGFGVTLSDSGKMGPTCSS